MSSLLYTSRLNLANATDLIVEARSPEEAEWLFLDVLAAIGGSTCAFWWLAIGGEGVTTYERFHRDEIEIAGDQLVQKLRDPNVSISVEPHFDSASNAFWKAGG